MSVSENEAWDKLRYVVGRACEPLDENGQKKSDERRMIERTTAEAVVLFATDTGMVEGGPAQVMGALLLEAGGYRT